MNDDGKQAFMSGAVWLDAVTGANHLEPSISRRGNRRHNDMAESFFHLLKRERIRRKTCRTRSEARQDAFDCIETFYNPTSMHVRNGMVSLVEFERQIKTATEGVKETRGDSTGAGPDTTMGIDRSSWAIVFQTFHCDKILREFGACIPISDNASATRPRNGVDQPTSAVAP